MHDLCIVCGGYVPEGRMVCPGCLDVIRKFGDYAVQAARETETYCADYYPYENCTPERMRRDMTNLEHVIRAIWARRTGQSAGMCRVAFFEKSDRSFTMTVSAGTVLTETEMKLLWKFGEFRRI